ncbi:CUE domain-containing protein 2-like [Limulus polyphemus]|uniref:CUE domain-containing protein 2-like n=1 Tax=Limulus polyphemus TaxID=6850 RepID=A0ABM1BZW8_LIMPO|nr:CUE domain-containing protein 2-like [Limulus polyphemus]
MGCSAELLVGIPCGLLLHEYVHPGPIIDEIILSYVVSILQSLGNSDAVADAFDVDQFIEMMAAYIPAFSSINSAAICEWMFEFARKLASSGKGSKLNVPHKFWTAETQNELSHGKNEDISLPCENHIPSSIVFPGNYKYCHSRNSSGSSQSCSSVGSSSNCYPSFSSQSRSRNTSNSSQSEEDFFCSNAMDDQTDISQHIQVLTEMFPNTCTLEIQHCVSVSYGDCQKAAQLLLQRQETDESLTGPLPKVSKNKPSRRGATENILDDKELRQQILSRYGYIDQDDDIREHRPVAPKTEPKKLIRYRDNKIVSIKGERYSDIKKEEPDEVKPARQHRFQ